MDLFPGTTGGEAFRGRGPVLTRKRPKRESSGARSSWKSGVYVMLAFKLHQLSGRRPLRTLYQSQPPSPSKAQYYGLADLSCERLRHSLSSLSCSG